jgi:hypothetical protein
MWENQFFSLWILLCSRKYRDLLQSKSIYPIAERNPNVFPPQQFVWPSPNPLNQIDPKGTLQISLCANRTACCMSPASTCTTLSDLKFQPLRMSRKQVDLPARSLLRSLCKSPPTNPQAISFFNLKIALSQ